MKDSIEARKLSEWIDVPPVFIVGAARSGTTLLRLMLSSHPRVSISSEGAYIYRLRAKFESYGDLSDPQHLAALYHDVLPSIEDEQFLSPPGFDQLFDWVGTFGADPRSIFTFFGTWEARVAGKTELAWWGDNAPYHVYQIPYFNFLFPHCKFILMVRDPRDACASSKVGLGTDIHSAVGGWEKSLLDGLVAASSFGPHRVILVKYEDLVRTPRARLREICQFLGIEYAEAMLCYYGTDAARAIAQLSHHQNLLKPVFADSIGKHREVLTKEEIATIVRRLSSPMWSLGYLSYEEYDEITRQG